jgi:ADP-ribosylglycohydrolase
VVPDRLLAGEYPLGFSAAGGAVQLQQLLEAGIDSFINLTQPGESAAYERLLPDSVNYHSLPLRDHDVPQASQQMRAILSALRGELRAGRCVYVHCRAGIGRTGTVIGCYLIEQGLSAEAALTELNRLWRQNALSKIWGSVPETEAQRDYVLRWNNVKAATDRVAELPTEELAVRSVRERFLGSLVGLAVCDALAAATQLRRPGSFAAVGDLLGGGPHELPRGAWSDDTAMALCLADSLVACGGSDPADQLERYLRWKNTGYLSATEQCLGISAATAAALARAQWRRRSFAGSHDPTQASAEPLSRLAPAVLFAFGDRQRALAAVDEATRVTSQSPVVLDCARLQTGMLLAALHGESKARVLSPAADWLPGPPLRAEVAVLATSGKRFKKLAATQPAGAEATTALAAAREALANAASFRDGALAAVNLGGNSDVVGAIYGQLAGAHFGLSAIPLGWRSALAKREQIEALADQLLTIALINIADAASARR